jgi:hypothetical protein
MTVQENYLPKKEGNPKHLVVPIDKLEAWEAQGYNPIGQTICFPGQEHGVFWKEILYSPKDKGIQKRIKECEKGNETMLSLISEIQSLIQATLARMNIYHAAACPPEYSGHTVDCHDLYLVLGDHKEHLKHIVKAVTQLEFIYINNHYDRSTGKIKR